MKCFHNLENFVREHEIKVNDDFLTNIMDHGQILTTFKEYLKEEYS